MAICWAIAGLLCSGCLTYWNPRAQLENTEFGAHYNSAAGLHFGIGGKLTVGEF